MKHVGDITKIHGYDLPPVDVITGGSPCQDLSLAGYRAGLAGYYDCDYCPNCGARMDGDEKTD